MVESNSLSPPDELYESPKNSFVAQFIGENNKLSGKVSSINGNVCEVLLDDGTPLKSEAVNVSAVGDRTTISLRPERVEVEPDVTMDNMLSGKISEILYLGDHLRIVMNVAGNKEFIAKVRNRGELRPLQKDQTITVGWSAGDCKALDPVA